MLFNTKVFDTALFNGGTTNNVVYSTDTLVFESFSLSDGSVLVMTALRFLGPTRELVGGSVPRGDGQYLTASYFRELVVEAEGIVNKNTAAELDAFLDTMRTNLRVQEGNLDYTDANGTVKRFVATCDSYEDLFAGREHYHITFCPWKTRFKCKVPFGKARDYTSTSLSITSSPTSQVLFNGGTYKAQPVISMNFSAASSVTAVSVENVTTGDQISYSGSISAGDILVFDSEQKQVTKAGTAVDFTGAFPALEPNSNNIRITITGSSFTAYTTYAFKNTYL